MKQTVIKVINKLNIEDSYSFIALDKEVIHNIVDDLKDEDIIKGLIEKGMENEDDIKEAHALLDITTGKVVFRNGLYRKNEEPFYLEIASMDTAELRNLHVKFIFYKKELDEFEELLKLGFSYGDAFEIVRAKFNISLDDLDDRIFHAHFIIYTCTGGVLYKKDIYSEIDELYKDTNVIFINENDDYDDELPF